MDTSEQVTQYFRKYDDFMKWREIHRSTVDSPHKWPITHSFDIFVIVKLDVVELVVFQTPWRSYDVTLLVRLAGDKSHFPLLCFTRGFVVSASRLGSFVRISMQAQYIKCHPGKLNVRPKWKIDAKLQNPPRGFWGAREIHKWKHH